MPALLGGLMKAACSPETLKAEAAHAAALHHVVADTVCVRCLTIATLNCQQIEVWFGPAAPQKFLPQLQQADRLKTHARRSFATADVL